MSGESQSDIIWRYAMRPTPADGDVRNAPLSVASEPSGVVGDGMVTSTDLSDELASFPRHLSFNGFAESQTQSQGPWLLNEAPADSTESQKENMHLSINIPSGSPSPLLSAPVLTSISHPANTKRTMSMATASGNKPVQSSHVTQHVMGASTRAPATDPSADPINPSAPTLLDSASLIRHEKEHAVRATPLKHKNKTVSFLSPAAPPSPPAITRIKSMPPRPNRYAPRDINPSSQDSFAGPLPPQDLLTFARHSSILNNTFIHTTRDGELGGISQRRTHVSSTSASEPTLPDDMASVSQSEQNEEEPTPSQIMRTAFDPSLSPPQAPQPVILAKDSQSDPQSQGSEIVEGSHSQDNSSSASYHLPDSEHDLEPTQPSTQPTQPNTQPTQPGSQSILNPSPFGPSTGGPSPLPVPAHRRREIAALQAARRGYRDEVVPETPQSTSAPSAQASIAPPVRDERTPPRDIGRPHVETQYDEIPKNPPAREIKAQKGKEKEIAPELNVPNTTSPKGKGTGIAKQSDVRVVIDSPARGTRSAAGKTKPVVAPELPRPPVSARSGRPRESEVVPDSQENEQEPQRIAAPPLHAPARRGRPRESEVIPDSQEEESPPSLDVTLSSPAVPLKDVRPPHSSNVAPPTPTPAAVKSSLRKGQLPEGVTHIRGRGRASSLKSKGKAMDVDGEDGSVEDDEPVQQDAADMDIDEEQQETEVDEPTAPVSKSKRPVSGRSIKTEKKTPAPKTQRKYTRRGRVKTAPASTSLSGPSTRSQKRKGETPADSQNDIDGRSTTYAHKAKRRRLSKALTPVPVPGQISTRVFARRRDRDDRYLPGTVTAMASPTDPAPSQTTAFRVHFDDGHEEDIDLQYMRQFEVQLHDIVYVMRRIKNKNRTIEAEVLVVERWTESELADVHDVGGGPDGDDFEVEGRLMSISDTYIREQWNERRVSVRTFRGDQAFDEFEIPEPNERLAGFGFVITLPDLPRSKRSLAKLIKVSGGTVFEHWTAVVTLDGSVETAGKRMTGTASALRVRKGVPKQLFCLTDEPSTTPKYLVALALGVPCISLEWVVGRALQGENQVDWPAYVLPAGYNPSTRLPASQAFDRAWWRETGDVTKLVSNPPVFKPFRGKSFLCMGTPQFLFSEKLLGTVPRVLLAMGASYVEAVTDIDRVKKRAAGFDYTVVDDGESLVAYQSSVPVDVSWIKKCLVTGVEGPVPWPDRDGPA